MGVLMLREALLLHQIETAGPEKKKSEDRQAFLPGLQMELPGKLFKCRF